MSDIKQLIDTPHPIYIKNYGYWNFLLDSYEGGPDYCNPAITGAVNTQDTTIKVFAGSSEIMTTQSGNLFRHPKELEVNYKERLRMSYYYNFCAPVIDIYTDHLFKQPVIENFGDIENDVEERRENIDNKGSSINEFRKETADLAQIYGHVFVLADSNIFDGEVNSRADLINNNLLPYFSLVHPQNVVNWALDNFGRAYWVLVRECSDGNKDAFNFDKNQRDTILYRLWTRQEWILCDSKGAEIARGTHGLGIVPITCMFDKQSKKVKNFLGISALADIAFIARDIYNSCSELKQILRDQTFAFLAVQGSASDYDAGSLGTSKGLVYPEGMSAPQYISPPSSNAEVYFSHIDRQRSKIFQMAKLEGGSVQAPQQSAVQQSGVSKAWDFNQTNSALSKKAGSLEDGETKLWQVFGAWVGKEFNGSVQYPHEFSVKSLNEDLDEAEKMFKIQLGAEFDKEIRKAIIQKKFPRMPKEEIDKLIKNMNTTTDTNSKGASGSLMDRLKSKLPQERLLAGK